MFENLKEIGERYEEVVRLLSDPEVIQDQEPLVWRWKQPRAH